MGLMKLLSMSSYNCFFNSFNLSGDKWYGTLKMGGSTRDMVNAKLHLSVGRQTRKLIKKTSTNSLMTSTS